jgi:Spy/CpxP family protein refolding chaperone
MNFTKHAAVATLGLAAVLAMGSSAVMARAPQQGPPDGQQDQPGGRMGMGMRGGMDGDDDRGPRGEGERRGGMRGGPMGMGMRWRGEGMREFGLARLLQNPEVRQQLGVSAEQAAKVRQQESDFRKAEIRNRADLQVKQLELRDLVTADKPDRGAIDAKLKELSTARYAMQKSAIDFHLNMRDALTPEQRQKLEQWMRQRREGGSGGNAGERGPRGRGPGGRGERGSSGGPPAPPNAPAPPSQ